MKRILTTLLLATVLLPTATVQATQPGADATTMPAKNYSPADLQPGENLYWEDLIGQDTTRISRLFREWNQYADQHPRDEWAWRNLYAVGEAYYLRVFCHQDGHSHSKQEFNRTTRLKERLLAHIPDSYTYNIIALEDLFGMTGDQEHDREVMHHHAAKALELLPDDAQPSDMATLIGTMIQTGDTTSLDRLLKTYFNRDMCPPYVLQYHFNELQGMPDGALYIGSHEGDIIPKLILQRVMGLHQDKMLYDQNFCYDRIYNAQSFSRIGIGEPDYDAWIRSGLSWNRLTVRKLCDESPRPVCFSAYMMAVADDWLTDDLRACLYNEGLTMRYAATPYDNFAVKRRNISERYLLEYLLYPFSPDHERPYQKWHTDHKFLALNYVALFQDQVPWYMKNDRKGYDRLARLIRRILKENTLTDAAEEDIPLTLRLPQIISEPDVEKPDSLTRVYHYDDGHTRVVKVSSLPEGMDIDDYIDSIKDGTRVEEGVDENGNKTVTTTKVVLKNEQISTTWQKK